MADRGRKALPIGNRLCNDRWVSYCQKVHYDKLNETVTTAKLKGPWNSKLNNTKPHTMDMPHIKASAKKAQQEAERFAEIELENRVLLSKMAGIIKQDAVTSSAVTGGKTSDPFLFRSLLQHKPGLKIDMSSYPCTDSRNFAPQRSLNKERRQREVDRIARENTSMLNRIVNRQPVYKAKRWEEERKRDLGYLKNIRNREVMHLSTRLSSSLGPGDLHNSYMGASVGPSPTKSTAKSTTLPAVDGAEPPPAEPAPEGEEAPAE